MSAPLAPEPLHSLPRSGELTTDRLATAVLQSVSHSSGLLLATLSATSPLLRHAVGINGQLWAAPGSQEFLVHTALKRGKDSAADPLHRSSSTSRHFVTRKKLIRPTSPQKFAVHPTLRINFGNDGQDNTTGATGASDSDAVVAVVSGVPEYDISISMLPLKDDVEWIKNFVGVKVPLLGPCLRTWRAAFTSSAGAIFQQIVNLRTLETLDLLSVNVSGETFVGALRSGALTSLRTLRLGLMDFEANSTADDWQPRLPCLKELALDEVEGAMTILQSFACGGALEGLELRNIKLNGNLRQLFTQQSGIRTFVIREVPDTQYFLTMATTYFSQLAFLGISLNQLEHLRSERVCGGASSALSTIRTLRIADALSAHPATPLKSLLQTEMLPRLESLVLADVEQIPSDELLELSAVVRAARPGVVVSSEVGL